MWKGASSLSVAFVMPPSTHTVMDVAGRTAAEERRRLVSTNVLTEGYG